jgi:hypothetical protein
MYTKINKSNKMHTSEIVCICNNLLHVLATHMAFIREAVQRITKAGTFIEGT